VRGLPCEAGGSPKKDEHFMRTLNKVLRVAVANAHNVDCALYAFLREYRLTPHATTRIAPSALCMNRPVGDTILQCDVPPTLQEQANERLHQRESDNDRVSQRRRAKFAPLQVGDQVLFQNRHLGRKFRLPFQMTPWTVVRRKGTLVTAQKSGESETSLLGTSDQDVHTSCGGCVENQESPHGTTPEGRKGHDLAETWEHGTVQEHVVSTPPRGGSERYNLHPRLLPSSKLQDFLVT
ncbi:hypothetical protein NDU88_004881, partial [Pleurodeles waltl]